MSWGYDICASNFLTHREWALYSYIGIHIQHLINDPTT